MSAISLKEDNIPLVLRQSKNWILWKLEGKTDTFKGTKIPYQVKNPYQKASTTTSETWGYFGEAVPMCNLHSDMSGIGYVFTADQGIIAIDLDGCIAQDGMISSPAKEAVDLFRGKTYIETSHSGKGYHILVKGEMPTIRLKGIEVYNYGRYFAITGNSIDGCNTITTLPDELEKLYSLYADKAPAKDWINSNWDRHKPTGQSLNLVDALNLRVEDIGAPVNQKVCGGGEIRGAHPFHGSTTGGNYAINVQKNVWICRRDGHNSGGGPLELFAVKEGIIQCENAQPGCLDGKWRDVFKALERAGYTLPDRKKPPEKDNKKEAAPIDLHCTDFGNAERFKAQYSNLVLYCKQMDSWFIWDDKGFWEKDRIDNVRELVKKILLNIYNEVESQPNADARTRIARWGIQCEKPEHVTACLNVLSSDPRIAIKPDVFDRDKFLFNTVNGTYDLLNHTFLQHDKMNFISRCVSYEFKKDMKCPKFLQFLNRIFATRQDKAEIIEYLQKAVGYSLTGDTSQQIIFLLYGSGSNGKSTLIETLKMLFGEYGTTVAASTLTLRKHEQVRNDLARLQNVRFVSASENAKGTILDEELIKNLSGGDEVTARFLFKEEFTFYPQLKLWWAFNHRPGIRDLTHALWRRLKMIPFEERIPDNERIEQYLLLSWHKDELPGILNWALEGLRKYQKEGLKDIDAVRRAIKEFKEESDQLFEFLEERCYIPQQKELIDNKDITESASKLYESYLDWAKWNGEKIMSRRKFSLELKDRGFKKSHIMIGTIFHNIQLK